MAEYIFRSPRFHNGQRTTGNGHTLIIDFVDLDSDKWRQYSKQSGQPLKFIYNLEFKRLLEYEKKINRAFNHSIFISDIEANLFYKLFPKAKSVHVIPNGVDTDYFSPDGIIRAPSVMNLAPSALSLQHPMLLFTGAMDYQANIDGVSWFCEKILPTIKKEYPRVQFYIVGSNPHPDVRALDTQNGVRVTGFVGDTRPYYASADVCVIPLRLARGVQNKVLESMAMEKPLVATSRAVNGIKAALENHLLIADHPKEFASKVSFLLKDKLSRRKTGISARKFVKKNYNWPTNLSKFEEILQTGKLGNLNP